MSSTDTSSVRYYPVHLVNHKNIYSKILYDVEGKIITTQSGRLINVFRSEMDDAMEDGWLRVFRNSTMAGITYRYFTTSKEQFMKFIDERDNGSSDGPNVRYHVYVDDDVDTSLPEYQKLFRCSREE